MQEYNKCREMGNALKEEKRHWPQTCTDDYSVEWSSGEGP